MNMNINEQDLKQLIFDYVSGLKKILQTKSGIKTVLSRLSEHNNPKFNNKYSKYFATKFDINPYKIKPEIEFVENKIDSEIFKNCLSFWSVPVSHGYGRRIRMIIWDKSNYKVIGIVGLCDPVIGMATRDNYIGWNKEQRKERLYNCMTAYVLGAVPPYNQLLCGKLVALLTISKEVVKYFQNKYSNNITIISKKQKPSELVMIDTMGAFGKSVIYNRLRGWHFIGYSKGYTHYHLTCNEIFNKLVYFLKQQGYDEVFKKKNYGDGPNWKFRVIQKCMRLLNLNNNDMNVLFLGIQRGYYIAPLAKNWKDYLQMNVNTVEYDLFSQDEQIEYWKQRWLIKKLQ